MSVLAQELRGLQWSNWQNNALFWFVHSSLYKKDFDTKFTDLKCQFSTFSKLLHLATQHSWYLRGWSSHSFDFSHFYIHLSPGPACMVIKSPKAVRRNWRKVVGEEDGGVVRRWFCTASCITGERSIPACCCPYGCEIMFHKCVTVGQKDHSRHIDNTFLEEIMA